MEKPRRRPNIPLNVRCELWARAAGRCQFRGCNRLLYKDVLVGEVWLCSGQSNMGLEVRKVINAADEVLVEAFLAEKLSFNAIAQGLEAALTWASTQPLGQVTLDTITLLDAEVRQQVIASF
jgi:1-deoxy-D-xylulose 5-phosphate reductoisomerase